MGMVPNGRNHSLRATRRPIAESTGRRPLFTLAIDRDIARFLVDQMVPVIGKLSKAASSDGVEIGLYSRDRTLSLLRQVRGLAQLLLPRWRSSPKAQRTLPHIGGPPDTIFAEAGAKEITAKMKLPRL
jgi:hypothetical protein